MLIIGEKIHILNPAVLRAVEERDPESIAELAFKQVEAGAGAVDINLGPGSIAGKLLPDIVKIIREHEAVKLFFPADAPEFTESIKNCGRHAAINAATAEPAGLARIMAAAGCFNADIVVLLTVKGHLPVTVDEWCFMAEEVLETAEKNNFPVEKLYLDPVLRTRFDPASPELGTSAMETGPVCQAIQLIKRLRKQKIRTLGGISNVSLHLPCGCRSPLHCSVLRLLKTAGLDAAILNPFDSRLMKIARAEADLEQFRYVTEISWSGMGHESRHNEPQASA